MKRMTNKTLSVLVLFFSASLFFDSANAVAQVNANKKAVNIPLTGAGISGSAGVGFTDFTVVDPSTNFKLDRGAYTAVAIERGFDVLNLYFTMTVSYMNAEGRANYSYTDLNSSVTYTASDVSFKANMFDLGLGFKIKLIDNYWFSPYIEGGGLGSYHEVTYTTKLTTLDAQGTDWRRKDVVMGSGAYAETGIEVKFSDKFGVKFAGRFSEQRSKELETLAKSKISLRTETYYLSALIGF